MRKQAAQDVGGRARGARVPAARPCGIAEAPPPANAADTRSPDKATIRRRVRHLGTNPTISATGCWQTRPQWLSRCLDRHRGVVGQEHRRSAQHSGLRPDGAPGLCTHLHAPRDTAAIGNIRIRLGYGFILLPATIELGKRSDIWARHQGPDLAGTASASTPMAVPTLQ